MNIKSLYFCAMLGVIISLYAQSNALADECGDVLSDGVRDLAVISSNTQMSSDTKKWFCSDGFESLAKTKSNNDSLGVELDGDNLAFSSENATDSAWEKRKTFCASDDRSFSENQSISILKQIASKPVIEAWQACINTKFSGKKMIDVQFNEIDSETFILRAKFTPIYTGQPEPVIDGLTQNGVTCTSSGISKGKSLTVQGSKALCERSGDDKIVIIIHTTYGDEEIVVRENLAGKPAGKSELVVTEVVETWKPGQNLIEDQGTGNHHCSRNCEGEPTRTNYTVGIDNNNSNLRIIGASLACISGPCGGWNYNFGTTYGVNFARGSFDVWSKPTTWRLTAKTHKKHITNNTRVTASYDLTYDHTITVEVPKKSSKSIIKGKTNAGDFAFDVATISENNVFKRVGISETSDGFIYTLLVKTP